MLISSNLQIYLKTTDTCNLNCNHCFTNGSNGKKIFFNPDKTLNFFARLNKSCPWIEHLNIVFHGGEPMLAPLKDLYSFSNNITKIFPKVNFSIQTNLVYNLNEDRRNFFKKTFLNFGMGTSWDHDIRFGSTISKENPNYESLRNKQIDTWEKNVKILNFEDNQNLTLMVCMSKNLIQQKEPKEIIKYAIELGFKHIMFERITEDGNATLNADDIPDNYELDAWMFKMWDQTIQEKFYNKIGNTFLNEISRAYVFKQHIGNRCRNCEQSILTLNASGTVGGCPNTATSKHWGHIDMSIKEMLNSKSRMKEISCETQRNPNCYTCPAFNVCNSDCSKLIWQGDKCAAPQMIFKKMIKDDDINLYRKLIY